MRTRTLPVLAVSAALLAGCGGGGDSAGEGAAKDGGATSGSAKGSTVTVKAFSFQPDPLEVKAGTEVTFDNQDDTLHDATSGPRDKPDGTFALQLEPKSKATYTFDEAGTYKYVCTIHPGPGMEAEIVVK